MASQSSRHQAVISELNERRQDLAQREIGSQVVLLAVPPGWGRSTVLAGFAADSETAPGPVTLVVRLPTDLPPGRALQAAALRQALARACEQPQLMSLLELDTAAGQAHLALGLGGLMLSSAAAAASLLAASLAVTAAGNVWDASPSGEAGGVARAGRALARVSASVPVVVIVDDADCLDPGLAVALLRALAGRPDGQVLVVAAAAPDSDLVRMLVREPGPELAGRVHRAKAGRSMGYAQRVELAMALLPGLPAAAVEQAARRTTTFTEVFAVAASGRLAELGPRSTAGQAAALVDTAAEAVVDRARPSQEAVVLAWAGGALHARQAERALQVLEAPQGDGDQRVTRAGLLARLSGPPDPQLMVQVSALALPDRRRLAAAVLEEAAGLAASDGEGVAERVVALQAAHNIRGDLADRRALAQVEAGLIRGLEALGDRDAAYDIAVTAVAELDTQPDPDPGQRQELLTAMLRLARTRAGRQDEQDDDPAVAEAVELALTGGATVGPEARVWAAVDLLHRAGRRQTGLKLARQVTEQLDARQIGGELAVHWRLLLAFHAGQAGDHALAGRLLAPLIESGDTGQHDAAAAVLRAIAGPQSGIRLQLILLSAELAATPAVADDARMRLHRALSDIRGRLGEYHDALRHATLELPLRRRLQGANHPSTLDTRDNIANWTGRSGRSAEALSQYRDLLPDRERVHGPGHRLTLSTRANIAAWTGDSGNHRDALALSREVLPDLISVLGSAHPATLVTRSNIAAWIGESGNAAEALRLSLELLPDRELALGPDHPDTLATRSLIAYWTGEDGNAAEALRLYRELLPDYMRILGPAHRDTFTTRANIARWTGEDGDAAEALRLYRELLPDHMRILGPAHRDTLDARGSIARWTGVAGNPGQALRLNLELLPDQEQSLGPGHPETLNTRSAIVYWTAMAGDPAEALRQAQELLPDQAQAMGPDHPSTMTTRDRIEALTAVLQRNA
jgi:hypothetical protein